MFECIYCKNEYASKKKDLFIEIVYTLDTYLATLNKFSVNFHAII